MRITTVNSARKKPSVQFSDINYRVGTHGTSTILSDLKAIEQNILLIIGTPVHTKWFRPETGHRLNQLLFDPMDDITASKIATEIKRILVNSPLEDRIVLTKVDVIPDPPNGDYYCEVSYRVPAFDDINTSTTFGLAA